MRAQGQKSQRRLATRAQRSVGAVLIGLLVAAFVPAPAQAESHMPWDQPGSAWVGTIDTQIRHTYSGCSYECPITDEEQATYTELRPLGTTADGDYDAHVVASGWRETTDHCYWTGQVEKVQRLDWTLDQEGPNPVSGTELKIGLTTNDEGQTFFAPWYLTHIPFTATNYCTEDGQPTQESIPAYNGTSFLGFTDGQSGYSSQPLPDLDADPLHLVGSKTWTLGDPPMPFIADCCSEYSFTVTYDLNLVIDECVDTNVTHDIYEIGGEAADFELRTAWCVTEAGEIRVNDVSAVGRTIYLSPMDAVLAEEFDLIFNVSSKWKPSRVETTVEGGQAVVKGTGTWKECFGIPIPLKTKYLRLLSDVFLHISVKADSRLVREAAIIVADLLDKAANKLSAGSRWLANKALDAVFEVLFRLPAGAADRILDLMVLVEADWVDSPGWAKDAVKDGIIAKEILIKKVINNEYCLTAWKPRIVHTLHSDGTAESRYVDLDGDYETWKPVRTGGST